MIQKNLRLQPICPPSNLPKGKPHHSTGPRAPYLSPSLPLFLYPNTTPPHRNSSYGFSHQRLPIFLYRVQDATMDGAIGKRNTPTLTARLNKAIKLFTLRTDIPVLATYAIRDVLREYLRDNTIIFCTRPPPWAGSKTALLEKILMENIGPVYFTEASPGKYNYLNPEDKKV